MLKRNVNVAQSKFTKYVVILAVFLLNPFQLSAQYISNGQEPSGIRWRQINSDQFQVIYPSDYENQAQLLTFWLEEAYAKVDSSMGSKPRKISVIMHSKTAYSNGMVLWAPRRVELFNSPHQEIDGLDWIQGLVIHEYRHVVQIEKLNQGFTEILSFLYGEQANVFPLGLYVPIWFLEGDAVATETALSLSGRGRQPEFLQGFKALTMEQGIQKYDKALLGTFNSYVPNYYEAGYYTVAVNRIQKDPAVFQRKMNSIGRNWIFPFGKNVAGLRDGKKKEKYYEFAFEYLNKQWQNDEEKKDYSTYTSLISNQSDYHDFSRLQFAYGKLLAWHTTLDEVPEIVEIKEDGSWQEVVRPGGYGDRTFSAEGEHILWTELRYDMRWDNRAWSDVYSYNMKTGEKRRITQHQRLAAPVLSPQKENHIFAAVEADDTDRFTLKIFDFQTGILVDSVPNPGNGYILHPTFSADGKSLVYVRLTNDGKGLYQYNLYDKREVEILKPSFVEIGYPTCNTSGIYFTGAWTGENNIYHYNFTTKRVNLLSNARFGANFSCSLNDSTIAFSNYTSDGYKPVVMSTSQFETTSLTAIDNDRFPLAEALSKLESGAVEFTEHPDTTFKSYKYEKSQHLFNFHSWSLPLAFDPVDSRLYPGLAILSQNILSTSFLTAGADFTPENALERYYLKYSYEGWYPKVDLTLKVGNDNVDLRAGPYSRFQWLVGGRFSLPLTWYKGLYVTSLMPSFSMQYASLTYTLQDDANSNSIPTRTFEQVNARPTLNVYRLRQRSVRDLYSKWGQVLEVGYNLDLSEEFNTGAVMYATTQLYFPGLFSHHSIIIGNAYQLKQKGDFDEDENLYYFKNDEIGFPRGEVQHQNHRLYSFTSDYRFPVAYPDWSLGKFIYLKRINMGLFYDFSRAWLDEYDGFGTFAETYAQDYYSAGGSLYFDLNPLRYEFNMRIGIQGGVNLRTQKYFNTLILSLSL